MAIIVFPKNPYTKSGSCPEQALQQLWDTVNSLSQRNAVMFESEGSFIHLASGGVLFKGKQQRHWRFKPFPGERVVHELHHDALNALISQTFTQTLKQQKLA